MVGRYLSTFRVSESMSKILIKINSARFGAYSEHTLGQRETDLFILKNHKTLQFYLFVVATLFSRELFISAYVRRRPGRSRSSSPWRVRWKIRPEVQLCNGRFDLYAPPHQTPTHFSLHLLSAFVIKIIQKSKILYNVKVKKI